MSAAVTERLIGRTPCIGVRLPAVRRREMRFLTADELQGLAGEVDERYAALVLLAGYVGLRWGETAGLPRKRLRLLERKLDIAETLIEIDGGRLESGPPTDWQSDGDGSPATWWSCSEAFPLFGILVKEKSDNLRLINAMNEVHV
jgi:hypothetical protein